MLAWALTHTQNHDWLFLLKNLECYRRYFYIYFFLFCCLLTKKLGFHGSAQKSPSIFFSCGCYAWRDWFVVACVLSWKTNNRNKSLFSFFLEATAKQISYNPELGAEKSKTSQLGCKLPSISHCSFGAVWITRGLYVIFPYVLAFQPHMLSGGIRPPASFGVPIASFSSAKLHWFTLQSSRWFLCLKFVCCAWSWLQVGQVWNAMAPCWEQGLISLLQT